MFEMFFDDACTTPDDGARLDEPIPFEAHDLDEPIPYALAPRAEVEA